MAGSIFTFFLRKLWDETEYLYGAKEQKQRCLEKLEWIQGFLKEVEADLSGDELFGRFMLKTREIASDIEDILAANVSTLDIPRHHSHRKAMDSIFRRIDDLSKSFETYNMREIRSTKEERFKTEREKRETHGLRIDSSDIVGFENNIEELVTLLTKGNHHVISISGIGGSGKTTLATAVYNHYEVRECFTHFSWVYISRQHQEKKFFWRKLLIGLLGPAAAEREEIFKMEAGEIASQLLKFLENQACLLVIDDIWTAESFNSLCTNVIPPKNRKNSKILLTTRNKKVASHSAFLHEIQGLDNEKCWELLEKKAGLRDRSTNLEDARERMEELGRTMVKHCAGLPLAITLLGGILYGKSTICEWDAVQTEAKRLINTDQDGGNLGVSWVLSLSYYELPQNLKPCFLSLAHFPEKSNIRVKELSQLWIAEGFTTKDVSDSSHSLEYTANDYVDQLVNRYMVQIQQLGSTGGVKAIRVHDLVRDFCSLRAQKENFVQLVGSQNRLRGRNQSSSSSSSLRSQRELSSNKVRRVALNVKYNVADELKLVIESGDPCLRSFVCFNTVKDPLYEAKLLGRLFRHFPLLRILKLENQESLSKVYLPDQIKLLTQLRLLSLQGSHVQKLPSAIRKLRLLQSLDLRSEWEVELPDMDWDFEYLRHLYLPQKSKLSGLLLGLKKLQSLQTLVNVSPMWWNLSELNHLTNLKKLTIYVDEKHKQGLSSCNVDGLRSFTLKSEEALLSVEVTTIRSILSNVYKLDLGVSIARLPEGDGLYRNLVKLTLRGTLLDSDGLSTLGMMNVGDNRSRID